MQNGAIPPPAANFISSTERRAPRFGLRDNEPPLVERVKIPVAVFETAHSRNANLPDEFNFLIETRPTPGTRGVLSLRARQGHVTIGLTPNDETNFSSGGDGPAATRGPYPDQVKTARAKVGGPTLNGKRQRQGNRTLVRT